jgi:SAM-dependent methyltransferase
LDFVIANHFIEHCQNPTGALRNMLRVVRPGGVVYLAVPDKRYTFDRDRPLTTSEHLLRDDQEGPAVSRYEHYAECVRLVDHVLEADAVQREVSRLMAMDYSIHFYVWTAGTFFAWLAGLLKQAGFSFEVALFHSCDPEILVVLRKSVLISYPSV